MTSQRHLQLIILNYLRGLRLNDSISGYVQPARTSASVAAASVTKKKFLSFTSLHHHFTDFDFDFPLDFFPPNFGFSLEVMQQRWHLLRSAFLTYRITKCDPLKNISQKVIQTIHTSASTQLVPMHTTCEKFWQKRTRVL
jgi:hypothetical protein